MHGFGWPQGAERRFPGEQKPVLIFEALQPAPRYVVLAWRRGLVPCGFLVNPFRISQSFQGESSGCPLKDGNFL
jgi:hypothetical protein